jgi:glutamate-ammonia-ligase adenylyltransferase
MPTADIPEILEFKKAYVVKHLAVPEHPLYSAAQRLLYVSDYAGRQIDHLTMLLQEDDCLLSLTSDDYQRLIADISLDLPSSVFSRALRYFRHRYFLRLMLRELADLATTQETMTSWSDCADALILHTTRYCEQQLTQRYGKPYHSSGEAAEFYVLAMGKLGGRELNFSSDIDLICIFSAAGCTDGAESISNEQYFTKVVQQLKQSLQTMTADGFVFRVDLRLRPNGDSGPLVSSLMAMETYYQEQGRDWERYAMVKARPISMSNNHDWFYRLVTPFVYRRYVDFGVIESLRSMKAMIEREIQINPMLNDIKRGRGGIREIEFIIQSFQLTRGGRLPQIRHQNAMAALAALKKEKLLSHTVAIQQAYVFLRKLENALQAQNDQQTHCLPVDPVKQAQLVMMMAYESWAVLLSKLHQYQRIISHAFNAVLNNNNGDAYQDEQRLLAHQMSSVWQGHVEPTMAVNLLASLGFKQAEHCYQIIHAFRHSPRCRRLSQAARMRLDRFMVLLLIELVQVSNADDILLHVVRLLENIVARSAYLALLTENSSALHELLYWFARSQFITSLLVEHPFLLEILIDQTHIWRPPSKTQLEHLLHEKLAHCSERDLQDDLLRQFKLTCWLRAARAELYGHCDAGRIGQFLADVAQVIIERVLTKACLELSDRYPDIMQVKAQFAIIAYGKLGSREMNYNSDVDLVFLHTAKPEDEGLVTRLTQKILHMLTTRLQTGVLYSVDTRLRPSGAAGLLVSHLDAFVVYQLTKAWTWEHQALLKGRVLFANQRMTTAFYELKKDVLLLPRNKKALRDEVKAMRIKMGKSIVGHPIKYDAGGLVDLEFLVQFLVLAHPEQRFSRLTNTAAQLQRLHHSHVLNDLQFEQLIRAYKHFHHALHQDLLQSSSTLCEKERDDVLTICRTLL